MLEAEVALILGDDVAAAHIGGRRHLQHARDERLDHGAKVQGDLGIGQLGGEFLDDRQGGFEFLDAALELRSLAEEFGGFAGAQQHHAIGQHVDAQPDGVGIDAASRQGGGRDHFLES